MIAETELRSEDMNDSEDEFEKKMRTRHVKKEQEKNKLFMTEVGNMGNLEEQIENMNESSETLFGFATDTLTLIFQPFYILLMWIFYDQNKIATNYGIAEEDFIFYFLYSVVVIPFQVMIDIFHYNIAEYYNNVPIYEYVKEIEVRFKNRKTNWKADGDDLNTDLEGKCQHLDHWCYSSQYYFILTIFMSGLFFVVLGNQIMISANHPLFSDIATLYIIVVYCVICIVLYFLTLYIAKILKIWVIKKKTPAEDVDEQNKDDELQLSREEKLALVTRKFGNWKKVGSIKLATDNLDEVIKEVQKMTTGDEKLRNQLVLDNGHWFGSNIKEVLTPTTLKSRRTEIIRSFKQIYGELSPRDDNEEEPKEEFTETKLDIREKKVIKKTLSTAFITIMKQWRVRAALIRKIRSQIAGIVEVATKKKCEYCGSPSFVRAEVVSNIESVFIRFLKDDRRQTSLQWSVDDWQEAFKKHALIRTICFECSNRILDHHIKASVEETRQMRVQARRKTGREGTANSTSSRDVVGSSKRISTISPIDLREVKEAISRKEQRVSSRYLLESSRIMMENQETQNEYVLTSLLSPGIKK